MRVPTSVWLFLVLTVLTCIVAYWADNLGKNLGKKRLSLFGLRPRQTATLISMASSVAIMLATFLGLTFISADFKNAVFRADRLNDNNQKLRRENKNLENQRQRSRAEVEQLKAAAQKSKTDATQAVQDEEKAKRETKVALRNTETARVQLASTRTQLTAAKSAVGAAKNALGAAKKSLTDAQQKVSAAASSERIAQNRSRAAEDKARSAESNARAAENQARAAEKQAASANTQKGEAQKAANTARAAANTARVGANSARATAKRERIAADKAKADADKANQELAAAQNEVKDAQEDLKATQESLRTVQESTQRVLAANKKAVEVQAQLEEQNRKLLLNNEDLRLSRAEIFNTFAAGNISIPVGQVFAERIIQPDQTTRTRVDRIDAIQSQLNELQNDALQVLKMPPINATSVQLLPIRATIDNQPALFDAEKLQRILIENLLDVDVPVAVRWIAARNHATDEKDKDIDGRLVTIEVRTVVSAGTILAQENIAAGQSDAAVFNRLFALTDKARGEARALGVIPPLSPQQPNFFAAGTNERVFIALREIQSRGGAVRVSLVADAALSSVAPPPVRFVIEAPENAASTRAPENDGGASPSS